MYPISPAFATALHASLQTITNKIEIFVDGDLGLTIEGRTVVDSAGNDTSLIDGSVDVRRATVSRGGQVVLSDVGDVLRPNDVGDLLVPMRSEVRPWRGLVLADGTTELVPLVTGVVTSVVSTWPTLTVTLKDRMELLNRNPLIYPYVIPRGTNTITAISKLLGKKIPASRLATAFPSTPFTTGLVVWEEGSNIAEKLHDLAESIGLLLYVDPMGVFMMRPEPDVGDDIVWSYEEGPGSMVMPYPSQETNADNAYNVVVTLGEQHGSSAPVRGIARNLNPTSALYVPLVGELPMPPVISAAYATVAQANVGAATILKKQGMSDLIGLAGIVHPALASGDVIHVKTTHPAGLDANLLLDEFTVPLRSAGPQNLSCRSRIAFS